MEYIEDFNQAVSGIRDEEGGRTTDQPNNPNIMGVKGGNLRSRTSPFHPDKPETMMISSEPKERPRIDLSFLEKDQPAPLDISDFECSLCFRLFCKPITTQCGHTYCKNCLLASLKYSVTCPLCRTELQNPTKKTGVNVVLLNVIEKHFKEQYSLREREEEEEEALDATLTKEAEGLPELEDYYTCWSGCLLPSVRETCCVLLSCT